VIEVTDLIEAIQAKKIPRSHAKDMTRADRRRDLKAVRRRGFREIACDVRKKTIRPKWLSRPLVDGSVPPPDRLRGSNALLRRGVHSANRCFVRGQLANIRSPHDLVEAEPSEPSKVEYEEADLELIFFLTILAVLHNLRRTSRRRRLPIRKCGAAHATKYGVRAR